MQKRMNLEKILREKLQQIHRDRKLSWLAEQTGIAQSTLSRAVNNANYGLGLSLVSKLVDFFQLSVTDPGINPVEYTMIKKVTAKAGAGSSLETSGAVEGYYAFRADFLARIGITPQSAVMMEVMGDSMMPLIMNGDTILVDQKQNVLSDGKIFLVGFEEELLVKRLQRTSRGWLLVSQNHDFTPIPVEGADLETLRVYGRVRWFGRVV